MKEMVITRLVCTPKIILVYCYSSETKT